MTEEEQLGLLLKKENEHIERKAATKDFPNDDLMRYVCAFSNEGGGHIIFGIKDDGKILGTKAFPDLEKLKHDIFSNAHFSRHIRVNVTELKPDHKRVIIVSVPSRPTGEPVAWKGAYWMRSGESLVPMDPGTLKMIMAEYEEDFSAQICAGTTINDLDSLALKRIRELWYRKAGNDEIKSLSETQMLVDLGLYRDEEMTYAAIILLGKKEALDKYMANAETVWEYRKSSANVEFQDRRDYRQAFLLYFDRLWDDINARNELVHIQEGFLVRDVKALNDQVIREAVLNAIGHRDYKNQGSVYIRQSPEQIVVESPGGFLSGINPENIVRTASKPRNRLIVEVFQKVGFVDRSGQGVDKIFKYTIAEGKGLPSYKESTSHSVKLTLNAFITDLEFVKYIERVINQTQLSLSVEDYITLEKIRENKQVDSKDESVTRLLEHAIIERTGRGRGYILSKQYYSLVNKLGVYTRKKGLDKDTNKELILRHLKHHRKGYAEDLMEALKAADVKRATLNNYLHELAKAERIELVGNRYIGRGSEKAYWRLKE